MSELPAPTRRRWQPLRIGLVNVYHYDREEFWFNDGHLLLRGNNGTGKSKVLSLTLPFLLDASLSASRVEPDGDRGKRMAWNLLLGGVHDRRLGYSWLELGRRTGDDRVEILTLGVGLFAASAKPSVDAWFFTFAGDEGQGRIGRGVSLASDAGNLLTKERLRDALAGIGRVHESARDYKKYVDEHLYGLGEARYAALMDTLVQLRQPQLSKRPDELALSDALTESLTPIGTDLLKDVADALVQLEEDRRQLEEHQQLAAAVRQFETKYRSYAAVATRREARKLRHAQSEVDTASRKRSELKDRFDEAQQDHALAEDAMKDAGIERELQGARLEALRSDPAMLEANRLELAEHHANTCEADAARTAGERDRREDNVRRAAEGKEKAALNLASAERRLGASRREWRELAEQAGVERLYAASPLMVNDVQTLAGLNSRAIEVASAEIERITSERREHVTVVRKHLSEIGDADREMKYKKRQRDARAVKLEEARKQRDEAEVSFEQKAQAHLDAWSEHLADLRVLDVRPEDLMAALEAWTRDPLAGEDPGRAAIQIGFRDAQLRLAKARVQLEDEADELVRQRRELELERDRLESGQDAEPSAPYTRAPSARDGRVGHPLWKLVDFRTEVDDATRARLEAALEGAGLLDAFVSPDGGIDLPSVQDTAVVVRPRVHGSLAAWLTASIPADSAIASSTVTQILEGIACEPKQDGEAWIGADGRFRLGPLSGAYAKPSATFIGFAARAAARARRLHEIDDALRVVGESEVRVAANFDEQAALERRAIREHDDAPRDLLVRRAAIEIVRRGEDWQAAAADLTTAEADLRAAEERLHELREALSRDARDLGLPADEAGVAKVDEAVRRLANGLPRFQREVSESRHAHEFQQRSLMHEEEARAEWTRANEEAERYRKLAAEAAARRDTLRSLVGAQVDEIRQRISSARSTLDQREREERAAIERFRQTTEKVATAGARMEAANADLERASNEREVAIDRLQHFAATGLISAALPRLELPRVWTIEPAIQLARRAEQELVTTKDDDASWERVQEHVARDFAELSRALSALGHRVTQQMNDWGFVVHIVYQNRSESPEPLLQKLDEEIAQRVALLDARERAVLENYLETEIASEVQRLLTTVDAQIDAINKELYKRPTTTGVRFKLVWEPLPEDDGAPVGLAEARRRLLNMNAVLWSPEDRRVIGDMFQQRIRQERERSDIEGGTLDAQLARALDYRRWHRFRVMRLQDGVWRKLSGPSSSGERALGLTVPLFAAVATFYASSDCPRLILLDEAFAGIDDAARAHCMGLIREFDLDFVVTSEREWCCYAELPGVSICQLQRREGIDAVYVSRWTWNGRARTRAPEPPRESSRHAE